MSPRPYQLGERKAAIEQTRARILEAARELLGSKAGVAGFTVDAVAAQAGVARMTVYYQFQSKGGLLEALFDTLAARGGIGRLRLAFEKPDPLAALDTLIALFGVRLKPDTTYYCVPRGSSHVPARQLTLGDELDRRACRG